MTAEHTIIYKGRALPCTTYFETKKRAVGDHDVHYTTLIRNEEKNGLLAAITGTLLVSVSFDIQEKDEFLEGLEADYAYLEVDNDGDCLAAGVIRIKGVTMLAREGIDPKEADELALHEFSKFILNKLAPSDQEHRTIVYSSIAQ